jgi:hypothetical protein
MPPPRPYRNPRTNRTILVLPDEEFPRLTEMGNVAYRDGATIKVRPRSVLDDYEPVPLPRFDREDPL